MHSVSTENIQNTALIPSLPAYKKDGFHNLSNILRDEIDKSFPVSVSTA
jgi:hypothetical protein